MKRLVPAALVCSVALACMAAVPQRGAEVPDDAKFEVVAHIAKHLKAEHHRVVDIDGVRVIFEDGWGLIRANNTQPALVLRVEAQSAARRPRQ